MNKIVNWLKKPENIITAAAAAFAVLAYLGVKALVGPGLLLLAFAQNVSFSVVSRSRNRNNLTYHIIAAIFSNGVWFLTFKYLITQNMSLSYFIPYCLGTVTGSVWGVKVSMVIERILHAESDSHLNKPKA